MSVRITLEIGHEASLRTKRTQEGFTHDWEVFVKGCEGADIQHYIDKVVFYLHETFAKPKRVVKEPPYSIKESGYAGFVLLIDIYLRNKDEPKKIKFNYDLNLQTSGPAIHKVQKEKYVFKDPNDEFKQRLLKGGGQIMSSSSSLESENKSNSDKNQLLNKPKLGGSIDHKKPKKIDEPRETTFKDLFGPPIKRTKTPEPKPSSGGGLKDQVKKDKEKDKLSDKDRKNKSPVKDRDKEKRDKDERKKDKSKERSKDHDRGSKDKKRDKSPRRSASPGSRNRGNSPKRMSSPKRPPSPSEPKSKDDRKEEKDKEKRKEKEKEDSKKYKKRDKEKDKEKEYKDHKDKDIKKELKAPSILMTMKEKEPSPLPPPPPTIKPEKKEKPKEIKPEVKPEASDADKSKPMEEKKDKHKHKKKDKDRDKDKEKRDKNLHKSKEKKYEVPGNNLFSTSQPPIVNQLPSQPQLQPIKHDKKKFALDAENDNSNSSCSSTKESEEYKAPSPAPVVQPPLPPPAPEPRLEPTKPKKDKTKKKEKKLEKEEKRRRRRDLSPGDDEPSMKTSKEEIDAAPVAADVDNRTEQENPEDYLRILQDLQHKIMSLQDNTELQKVVKLIAETGRYEVSARTFDFDLCLLERSTVRRLQEFFSVSS